jgi:hypothetical protein
MSSWLVEAQTRIKSSKASKIATLALGKSAWFQIFYNDGMALEHKQPFPVSAKVRVAAPRTERAFVINGEIQACCGVEVSLLFGAGDASGHLPARGYDEQQFNFGYEIGFEVSGAIRYNAHCLPHHFH